MRPDLLAALFEAGTLVLDGGLATQLEAQGNDLADALWSARLLIEHPEEIRRAHLAFFRAGARIAITSSYQATVEGFARRGVGRAEALGCIRRSVALAAEARDAYRAECGDFDPDPLLVAASVGPYGAFLADGSEYRGRYGRSVAQLVDFHRERFEVLVASDADLLACETIPELEEGEALVRLLDETPGAAGWLSFSCMDGGHLRSGMPVEAAFGLANASSAVVAVGVNCTAPEYVTELVERARSVTAKPIVVYPNSGEAWDAASRRWTDGRVAGGVSGRLDGAAASGGAEDSRTASGEPDVTREPAASGEPAAAVTASGEPDVTREPAAALAALAWVAAGAGLVGGCCRVGPAQIAEIAAAIG